MSILMEYVRQYYVTLILLAGLIVILIANRNTKIKGLQYIWIIMGLVLAITLCEYLEVWCSVYNKPVWILYLKAGITYTLHSLIILLEVYLIAPVKHKILILLPFLVELVFIIPNMFGIDLICSYDETNYSFISGKFHVLPALTVCFYMVLLLNYSLGFLCKEDYSKSLIVFFITFAAFLTVFLEYLNIIPGHITDIAAIEIILYYFYLAAIQQNEIQKMLYKSNLELEKQKNELLMAQIQPHFINNSLLAIQARCIEYPEIYDSIKHFSRYLRSNFENMNTQHLITFEQELKNIKAYLALEKMNFGERLTVDYDIDSKDFLLPALSVEPLVENAVRHGIAGREKGGIVQIVQRDEREGIIIEVRDIGYGRLNLTKKQEKRKGIGIANVRARLAVGNRGELELIPEKDGTCARITLKTVVYANEEKDGRS